MFFFKSILLIVQQMVIDVHPGEEVKITTGAKSSGAENVWFMQPGL